MKKGIILCLLVLLLTFNTVEATPPIMLGEIKVEFPNCKNIL